MTGGGVEALAYSISHGMKAGAGTRTRTAVIAASVAIRT
jgi:hypothetical protein